MTRRATIALASLAAVVVAALAPRLVRDARRQEVPAADPRRERAEETAERREAPVPGIQPGESLDGAVVDARSADGRRAEPTGEPALISGRVRLWAPLPPDEEVLVVATVEGPRPTELSARMSADGSFRIPLPHDATHAELSPRSRFLWLAAPVRALPGQADVVLEPEVLAVVSGEVEPPPTALRPVLWSGVEIDWRVPWGSATPPERVAKAYAVHVGTEPVVPLGGRFEVPLLPTGIELELHVQNPFGPHATVTIPALAPGERHAVRVQLEPGVRVSGRVVDEHGAPVHGLGVAPVEGEPMSNSVDGATTDADGAFVLERLPRRPTRIWARGFDLARVAETTVDGTHGDVEGVLLTVMRGGSIGGTVKWVDGEPVADFEVSLRGPTPRQKEGAAGRFAVKGLLPGSYEVVARAVRDGLIGVAAVSGVRPGGSVDLVLATRPAFTLQGLAVDAEGAPVDSFGVRARAPALGRNVFARGDAGRFELDEMEAGEWLLELRADGFLELRERLELDGPVEPLRLVLPRACRVRGRVVDPHGEPVADARLFDPALADAELDFRSRVYRTARSGEFDIAADQARMVLVARQDGWAPSATVTVDLRVGEDIDGVVLVLREACRVEGRVLDEQGRPLAGAALYAEGSVVHRGQDESDAEGAFVLDALPPGLSTLVARHPDRPGASARANVELVPGRTARAELRFAARDPVRLVGRVTRASRASVACRVELHDAAFDAALTTDADGRFELELQRPGVWTVTLIAADAPLDPETGMPTDVRRFELTVPDAESHEVELDLDELARSGSGD